MPSSSLNPSAASFVPSCSPLNPAAAPYMPHRLLLANLTKAPFFQQRMDRFLGKYQQVGFADLDDVAILPDGTPGTVKKQTIFTASYKDKKIAYEADALNNPRSGAFRYL